VLAETSWNGFAVNAMTIDREEIPGVFQLNDEGIHHACFQL
jgi:hypothetical protein